MKSRSLFNLALRGLSMGARFILTFFIGKYFSTEDLGMYGLFFTTVTLAVFLLGFDFYTYSNREILYVKEDDKLSVLREQFLFYGITYVVFLLPLFLIFFYGVLPYKYILLFYVILIFEHLSQEFYRLFTVMSQPMFANLLLFLRSGIWIYLLIVYYLFSPQAHYSLDAIFIGWLIGSGLSVVLGFIKIFTMFRGYSLRPVKATWFVAGLKVCLFYFFSTVALKAIEFANRYIVEYFCDLKSVGVFTFYSQIANAINVVIFTLFIMILYPALIVAVNENKVFEYYELKKQLIRKVLVSSVVLSAVVGVIIYPVLHFIGKEEYYGEITTFYILILSNIFLNVSLIYHYILYAFKKDIALFVSTLICAVVSMILNVVLIKYFAITGAAIALLLSYILLTLTKAKNIKLYETDLKNNAEKISGT